MMVSEGAAAKSGARTCVGCRETAHRRALLRFVLAGDPPTVVPAVRHGDAGGRGASVHPRYRCLVAAVERGGFKRAFKRDFPGLSAQQLSTWAREQYLRRVTGLMTAAARGGFAAVGTDAVRTALADDTARVALLVVAEDAAGRRDELTATAARLGRRCVVIGDKEHLGGLFGRASLGVVAILHEDIAAEVSAAMQCVAELAEDA